MKIWPKACLSHFFGALLLLKRGQNGKTRKYQISKICMITRQQQLYQSSQICKLSTNLLENFDIFIEAIFQTALIHSHKTTVATLKKGLQIFLFIWSNTNKYFLLKGLQHSIQYIFPAGLVTNIDLSCDLKLFSCKVSSSPLGLFKMDDSCNSKVDYSNDQHQRWEHLLLWKANNINLQNT